MWYFKVAVFFSFFIFCYTAFALSQSISIALGGVVLTTSDGSTDDSDDSSVELRLSWTVVILLALVPFLFISLAMMLVSCLHHLKKRVQQLIEKTWLHKLLSKLSSPWLLQKVTHLQIHIHKPKSILVERRWQSGAPSEEARCGYRSFVAMDKIRNREMPIQVHGEERKEMLKKLKEEIAKCEKKLKTSEGGGDFHKLQELRVNQRRLELYNMAIFGSSLGVDIKVTSEKAAEGRESLTDLLSLRSDIEFEMHRLQQRVAAEIQKDTDDIASYADRVIRKFETNSDPKARERTFWTLAMCDVLKLEGILDIKPRMAEEAAYALCRVYTDLERALQLLQVKINDQAIYVDASAEDGEIGARPHHFENVKKEILKAASDEKEWWNLELQQLQKEDEDLFAAEMQMEYGDDVTITYDDPEAKRKYPFSARFKTSWIPGRIWWQLPNRTGIEEEKKAKYIENKIEITERKVGTLRWSAGHPLLNFSLYSAKSKPFVYSDTRGNVDWDDTIDAVVIEKVNWTFVLPGES